MYLASTRFRGQKRLSKTQDASRHDEAAKRSSVAAVPIAAAVPKERRPVPDVPIVQLMLHSLAGGLGRRVLLFAGMCVLGA